MAATTAFKRLFVRRLQWTLDEDGGTLLALLKSAAEARINETQSGKILTAASGNGRTAQWSIPNDFSPRDAVDFVSELIDRYYEAQQKLMDDGTAFPTDAQIIVEILDKLNAIRSVSQDFSSIRDGASAEEADE